VVHTLRYTEAHGTAYIVMDFVEGDSLKGVLTRARTLEQSDIEAFLFPLLDGLGAVHKAGFLHRDIKPDNIYIRADNGQPVLLDFGIARMMARDTHSVMHTPGFAPPEQHESRAPRAPSADLYAIGATLYRCMAGHAPPDSRDRLAAAALRRSDPFAPLAEVVKGRYTPQLIDAVDRALRLNASERPQSVDEFKAMILKGSAKGVSESHRSSARTPAETLVPDERAQRPEHEKADDSDSRKATPKPRRRAAAAVGIAVLVAAAGAAGYLALRGSEAPRSASTEVSPPAPDGAPQPGPRSAKKESALEPGRVFRDCPDCPEMVVIPAGTFMMGSPENEKGRTQYESPQQSVNVPHFAIGKYAITRGEFAVFVRQTGHRADGCNV
jgi:serine/threonine protein kinase